MTTASRPAGGLFNELRRRRVLRTLALYILGAWGLMQVADVLLPAVGLPDEALRYVLLAAVAGFPVALVFGWFFDITAGGIRRTAPRDAGDVAAAIPLRAVDYGLLLALVTLLGFVVYGAVDVAEDLPLAVAPSTVPAPRPQADPNAPPMVGVLPFAHMGSTDEGEFFAAGIHDDLLTRLAKLGGLRVISRTSVLQYAGTAKTIPEIASEIGADAILEGGVRTAGGQIRINAQLIDARTDEHLWAETFDRSLTADNIFTVQTDIARAISNALQATLTPEDVAELDLIPTSNLAAYREFHEIMRWRETVHLDASNRQTFIDGLQRAIDLDPNFTRPMVELTAVLSLNIYFGRGLEELPRVEALVERISEIAPNSADAFTAQSLYVYYVLKDFDRAEGLVQQAQQRAPSDPQLLNIQSWIQRRSGNFEGYLESARQMALLDPNDPANHALYAFRLAAMQRYDAAEGVLQDIDDLPMRARLMLVKLELREHASLERYVAELDELASRARGKELAYMMADLWDARLAMRDFDGASEMLATIPQSELEKTSANIGLHHERILHFLLLGQTAEAREAAALAKRAIGIEGVPPDDYPEKFRHLERAVLALAEDRPDLTRTLLLDLEADPERDRAEWLGMRHYECQLLAMAEAPEAIGCLESVLNGPSTTLAYFEPLLPFYDGLRGQPAFESLIAAHVESGKIPVAFADSITAVP